MSGGRVMLRPVGSPIMPVPSPMTKITVWPHVLEVLHFAQQDGVAQVQVGRGGVEADLDPQAAGPAAMRSRSSSSRMISTNPFEMYCTCSLVVTYKTNLTQRLRVARSDSITVIGFVGLAFDGILLARTCSCVG